MSVCILKAVRFCLRVTRLVDICKVCRETRVKEQTDATLVQVKTPVSIAHVFKTAQLTLSMNKYYLRPEKNNLNKSWV